MYQRQNYSRDDAAMDHLGNRMTGGFWSLLKQSLLALCEANANFITMLLRKKQGALMFSFGKLFWMAVWIGIAMLIFWENGRPLLFSHSYYSSWNPFWFHVKLIAGLFLLKWIIAALSIGSQNPRWFRARDSVGESISWWIFARFLRWLRLACKKGEKPRFFQLSARRWMLIIEPLGLLLLSLFFYYGGLTAYGNFLFWATLAFAYTTFRAMKQIDMAEQITKEAERVS